MKIQKKQENHIYHPKNYSYKKQISEQNLLK